MYNQAQKEPLKVTVEKVPWLQPEIRSNAI